MGGGCYSYLADVSRKMQNATYSTREVFKQRAINAEMNIKGKIRESRDSEEHPESLPIIIALDVTGSMGYIPYKLVTEDFPKIMKKIMDEGIAHPQVCFLGIGDQYLDDAPLQVGQFESSDDLLDKWLKLIWLEGGGGGNNGESYQLAWWFAAHHTQTDQTSKRSKKGILITIGDEPVHKSLSKTEIEEIFGDKIEVWAKTTSQILEEVRETWDVYHINVMDYSGAMHTTQNQWKELLQDNSINTEDNRGSDIANIIAGIIISTNAPKHTISDEVSSSTTEDSSSLKRFL
jgi:hypothetical protein